MKTLSIRGPKPNVYRFYDLILALSVATLIISNIVAVKLISIGSLISDGGAIIFPLSYILADILTEVYGYAYARRAIWVSFSMLFLAVIIFKIVGFMAPAAEWQNQSSYDAILGFVPRIVIASLTAYLFGQFINSFVIAKLKILYRGKRLWLRLIGSTVIGELVDTIIFAIIAFSGVLHGFVMVKYILIGWVFKLLVEVILLPLTYKVINALKKAEHVDKYDHKTDFTPFSIRVN